MSYLVISNNLEYKLAKVIESHKNHDLVEILPEKLHKKIKSEQKILAINPNNIEQFQAAVNLAKQELDLELLLAMLDDSTIKYHFQELAKLYFGDQVTETQATALLFKLAEDNIKLNNYSDGNFSQFSLEEQQHRLNILQEKQQEQAKFDNYVAKLLNLQNPCFDANVDNNRLLHKPDKHSLPHKALAHASKELNLTPLELATKVGLIDDLAEFFTYCFMHDNFPKGINYLAIKPNMVADLATIEYNETLKVFSIDDVNTTEIDDAFSVSQLDNGNYQIGVHIAAPALDSSTEEMVADNISTVYYPGHKLPMLPEAIINQFSLVAGAKVPVVSIYFTLDQEFTVLEHNSKLEIVTIHGNLRIEKLEQLFNQDNLFFEHGYAYEKELKILYNFANKLEEKRGKPSTNNLVLDYTFSFDNGKIKIKPRLRGNPIDKLVSELMIMANCSWGRMLTNAFIPAIYRVKQPNYPVKMTLTPDSHTGLNVDYYTWATSPLRRAADYINQRQIISLILQDKNYLNAINPILLEVVENFDSKYAKYMDFQTKMERYWSLKYLLQENITELNAIFTFKTKTQLDGIPIELDVQGITTAKPKGTQLRLKIYNLNLAKLSFDFKIIDNN